MFSDPIADMLTRIRNASKAGKAEVVLPYSKFKENLAQLLEAEGFLGGKATVGGTRKLLTLQLKYDNNSKPVITDLKRVSKPGQRVYLPAEKLPKTMSGYGITVVSTSQGLMTDRAARKAKVGGEVVCQVW